ncbi:endonuclease/exonuclease/phosphatase family protein [Arenibacter certesii]|uniref:Endonuclease n=1 Tax=Arenibacter certesii TaxID=228955 RepID=A0A918IMT1_9FLAO|nr:endonuclease/exonuclease/phosphatase family protein [Arenibacter certesii]GGW21966.1 endonuclease [Arenibacter certesii]
MKSVDNLFLIFIIIFFTGVNITFSQTFRVGSYNLRYDNPNDSLNNWKYRQKTVANLIQFHDFEIFGTQEGLVHQLEELSNSLPNYAYIGVGRDDGKKKGEYSAIFYNTQKFQLMDKGDFWLSQDPTQPNKGWDAALPRICSWGKFKDKVTNFTFFFFNVHFDHVGTKARLESAKLILKKIKEITRENPVLLTGDFNIDQTSEGYKILDGSPILKDAYNLASLKYGAEGTFNGFNINLNRKSRIDHIFVSDNFNVLKHGILTDTYHTDVDQLKELQDLDAYSKDVILYANEARLPSDHYPVLTVLTY